MPMDKRDKRLNVILPMRTIMRIEGLKEATQVSTTTEVIKSAILAYEALVKYISDGNKVYICKSGDDKFYPVYFVFDVVPACLDRPSAGKDTE
jgi:hypothetical protein